METEGTLTGRSSSPAAVEGRGKLIFPAGLLAGTEARQRGSLQLLVSRQETCSCRESGGKLRCRWKALFPDTEHTGKDKVLGWPNSSFSFLRNIKDTFFIFTNNFTDLYFEDVGSLPVLASSGQRPGVLVNICQCTRQPHSKELFGRNINSTKKLHKPLLTVQSVAAPSPYAAQIFFCISVACLPFLK